jgi:hypothetical protein
LDARAGGGMDAAARERGRGEQGRRADEQVSRRPCAGGAWRGAARRAEERAGVGVSACGGGSWWGEDKKLEWDRVVGMKERNKGR